MPRPPSIKLPSWARLPPRLADWRFSVKMGLLPGIGIIALIVIVCVAISTLAQQTRLIETVVHQDMDLTSRLSESATRLQRIDAGIYRILALQAARAEERPVTDAITNLLSQLDRVLADLAAYQTLLPAGQHERLQSVIGDLQTYRGAIEVVGSMLELDFASAVALIRPFDGNTRSILAALSELAEETVHDAASRAEQSTVSAARASNGFAAAAGLLALTVGALALLITRATVRSVGAIAEATVLVARGDRSVDIMRLQRRDELGAIVDSLQSFQDNVARVAFLAHHDALTGLPNRILFNDRLQSALAQLDRNQHFAVLCLDLDRFKAVNDTLGHPVGDLLLRTVADRICACVRHGDTVARLGGDEFAVVGLNLGSDPDAAEIAERIIKSLNEPFSLDGYVVSIGCSIGIATAPRHGTFADKLLKNADTALYRAKTEGRNIFRFFELGMDLQLQLRRELEIDMRRAIAAREFELHYQPLITVATMKISGFEALMRWRHAERGMISPGDFIPVAEETGLIVPLGEFALMQACQDAMQWPDSVGVSVNLSPMQFKDANLLQAVLRALEISRLPPRRLELEITESVLLHHSDVTLALLRDLRGRGVRIAMDDFGTGYSSLSYLSSFPFDKIKIDQSFVRDLTTSESSVAIVRAVTGLSGSLGVTTTAEGVETDQQFKLLVAEGCTEVQGYLFGRPTPASQVPFTLAELGYRALATDSLAEADM